MSPATLQGLRLPWFDNTVMRVPARTFHTLVFGAGLTALTRVLLAWFTDQRSGTVAAGYAGAAVVAYVLSKQASRMADRTPRLFTSSFSLTTFAVSGTVSVAPTARSNQLAAATILFLAVVTFFGELLHRLTSMPAAASTQGETANDSIVLSFDEIAKIITEAKDAEDVLRQFRELAEVR